MLWHDVYQSFSFEVLSVCSGKGLLRGCQVEVTAGLFFAFLSRSDTLAQVAMSCCFWLLFFSVQETCSYFVCLVLFELVAILIPLVIPVVPVGFNII